MLPQVRLVIAALVLLTISISCAMVRSKQTASQNNVSRAQEAIEGESTKAKSSQKEGKDSESEKKFAQQELKFKELLEQARGRHSNYDIAHALNRLGGLYFDWEKYEQAQELYLEAIRLFQSCDEKEFRKHEKPLWLGLGYGGLGTAY